MSISIVFIFSIIILFGVDHAFGSRCSLEPEHDEGKHWLLWLNVSKLDSSIDPDIFAYWLARDNGFKVLYKFKSISGFYVCEFRESELDAIREQTPAGQEDKTCRRQRKAIAQGQIGILEHPAVDNFVRKPSILTYTRPDEPGKTREVIINQAVGCKHKNEDHTVAGNELHFVETEEEKEIYFPCFIDVIDIKRRPLEIT